MKILFLNLGYCKGLYGSLTQYILQSYRYLFTSKKIQKNIVDDFKKLIKKENPDIICIAEIEKGYQIKSLVDKKYPFYDFDVKYGANSFLRNIPFFRKNGNAFLSKKKIPFKRRFLKNGTKKLLYDITLPNKTQLLMFHYSLKKSVRPKQFEEVYDLIKNNKKNIVCGDFNVKSYSEIESFAKKANLKLAGKGLTFPTSNPKEPRDFFLCSKNIKAKSRILKNKLSDHLGVVLEVKI